MPTAADVQEIRSQAVLRTCWLTGDPAEPGLALQQQLMHRPQPAGPGYIWLAGESGVVRTLRAHFLNDQGLARTRLTAKGYWKHGEADHRDRA
ncbi:Siderophore-interacting protein [compost metagenome]